MPLSRVNLGPLGLQPGQRDPLEDLRAILAEENLARTQIIVNAHTMFAFPNSDRRRLYLRRKL
tara:strand:+ start:231 stop:419 length:189 start_codon:yes stop_codon:yes gene_type:complete